MKKLFACVISMLLLCCATVGFAGCGEEVVNLAECEIGYELPVKNNINGEFPFSYPSDCEFQLVEFSIKLKAVHSLDELSDEIPFQYEFLATVKATTDISQAGKEFWVSVDFDKFNSFPGRDVQRVREDGSIEFLAPAFCDGYMSVVCIEITYA